MFTSVDKAIHQGIKHKYFMMPPTPQDKIIAPIQVSYKYINLVGPLLFVSDNFHQNSYKTVCSLIFYCQSFFNTCSRMKNHFYPM